jgi:hypothetical protein
MTGPDSISVDKVVRMIGTNRIAKKYMEKIDKKELEMYVDISFI